MKLAILYDGGAESWSPEDIQAVLDSVGEVYDVLSEDGHEVRRIAVRPDLEWFETVQSFDLVFNLCEGIGGVSELEIAAASALDLTGIPYTGCSAWTSTICHRKPVLNAVLQSNQLPVPRWFVPDRGPIPSDWPLPSIVKPAAEDASIGIEQGSVVTTREDLEDRVRHVQQLHGRAYVQEYVHGREIAAGFVGDHALPLSEIDFGQMPEGAWPIVSFAAKWHEGSDEYIGTEPICPAEIEPQLADRVVSIARRAWEAVEGRGYGRVDFRVDAQGQPWILEVNPNPDLSRNAGLARMARAYGWSHATLVNTIVHAALAPRTQRAPGTRPPAGAWRAECREASLA